MIEIKYYWYGIKDNIKRNKHIFGILSIDFKKVFKENISKHCFTGNYRVDISQSDIDEKVMLSINNGNHGGVSKIMTQSVSSFHSN